MTNTQTKPADRRGGINNATFTKEQVALAVSEMLRCVEHSSRSWYYSEITFCIKHALINAASIPHGPEEEEGGAS